MLVFVLVAGIGFGWLGTRLQRARKNRQAFAKLGADCDEIRKLRGMVWSQRIDHGPSWLDNLLDDPGKFRVFSVEGYAGFGDEGLTYLKKLSNLPVANDREVLWFSLKLDGSQVTDVGLGHIKELVCINRLDLSDTQVTDAGLVHLEGLTNLRDLSLRGTQVSDAGLAHLQGLTDLAVLHLLRTQVTDEGVKTLQRALPYCAIGRQSPPLSK
jgi:hypothetical protein